MKRNRQAKTLSTQVSVDGVVFDADADALGGVRYLSLSLPSRAAELERRRLDWVR